MSFPTTRWSLLAQATIHGDAVQREALLATADYHRALAELEAAVGSELPSGNQETSP